MHPSYLRHLHACRIFHAIRVKPGMSQREIADTVGSDKSTVSTIVHQFDEAGLIDRRASAKGGRGRPGESIYLTQAGVFLVGVHFTTDAMRLVAANPDGSHLGTYSRPMPATPDRLDQEVMEALRKLLKSIGRNIDQLLAIGVAVAGLVRHEGTVAHSPNLGWRDVPLRSILERSLPASIHIDNNAHAAAAAEFMFGAGIDGGDFLYIESGSGVGGALFVDGVIYRGHDGYAGEFGHMKIVPHGRLCRCGNVGCLSAYTSDYSIMARVRQSGVACETRADLHSLADAGDRVVLETLAEAGSYLGLGLANLVNVFNPPLVILGGGFARLAPHLMPTLQKALRDAALPASALDVRIEPSTINTESYPMGGAALALKKVTSLRGPWELAPWEKLSSRNQVVPDAPSRSTRKARQATGTNTPQRHVPARH
jgi:predicted NBD/HSP70 family sugar kinase